MNKKSLSLLARIPPPPPPLFFSSSLYLPSHTPPPPTPPSVSFYFFLSCLLMMLYWCFYVWLYSFYLGGGGGGLLWKYNTTVFPQSCMLHSVQIERGGGCTFCPESDGCMALDPRQLPVLLLASLEKWKLFTYVYIYLYLYKIRYKDRNYTVSLSPADSCMTVGTP